MPVFALGETRLQGLHGSTVISRNMIERETRKAILLAIVKSGEGMQTQRNEYWIPKAVVGSLIRLSRGELVIDDWFWEKECSGK